jgi:hypothetical protein
MLRMKESYFKVVGYKVKRLIQIILISEENII